MLFTFTAESLSFSSSPGLGVSVGEEIQGVGDNKSSGRQWFDVEKALTEPCLSFWAN